MYPLERSKTGFKNSVHNVVVFQFSLTVKSGIHRPSLSPEEEGSRYNVLKFWLQFEFVRDYKSKE